MNDVFTHTCNTLTTYYMAHIHHVCLYAGSPGPLSDEGKEPRGKRDERRDQ